MRAAIRLKYGNTDVLSIQEIPKPTPGDKEILVRVYACTVNRTDWGVLSGLPYVFRLFTGPFKPRFASTGTDFAGVIEAIGKDVTTFKIGDRVWGFKDTGSGSHAEYVVVSEDFPLVTIPEGIRFDQAAASAEGAHYAYNFINMIKLKPGDTVLVNGATGAIGSAAVQLLKYFGTRVTAVCGTDHLDLVKSIGADRVIDYQKEDFTKSGEKYHYIFDAVGKSSFGKCKPLLHPGGVYMSSELGPGGENLYLPLFTKWSNKRLIFPLPSNPKRSLVFLRDLLEKNKFRPVIDRTYPLEKIADAFNYVAKGQKIGNVILSMES